jgi:hypothetical protein
VVLINCSAAATPRGQAFVCNFGQVLLGKRGGHIIASRVDVSLRVRSSLLQRAWTQVFTGQIVETGDVFVQGDWVSIPIDGLNPNSPPAAPAQKPAPAQAPATGSGAPLSLKISLKDASQERNLNTDALTNPTDSPTANVHLQSGPPYSGEVEVIGTMPPGYEVYVFYHSQVWDVLGPTGGTFVVQEQPGFGAANDVEAWACLTGGKPHDPSLPSGTADKPGSPPKPGCLGGQGTDIGIYWNP